MRIRVHRCRRGRSAGVTAFTTDSSTTRPSALPSDSSQARSGCGIRPTTLRRSLQMPAMLFDRSVWVGLIGRNTAGVA